MIESDARLKSILAKLSERPVFKTRKLMEEVFRLQSNRPTPKMRNGHGASILAEETLRLSADRSRIVGIKMQLLEEKLELQDAYNALEDYLRERYQSYLQRGNAKLQQSTLNKALRPIAKRIEPIERALQIVDTAMEDYLKAGFEFSTTAHALTSARGGV